MRKDFNLFCKIQLKIVDAGRWLHETIVLNYRTNNYQLLYSTKFLHENSLKSKAHLDIIDRDITFSIRKYTNGKHIFSSCFTNGHYPLRDQCTLKHLMK